MAVEPKTKMPQQFAERLIALRTSRGLSCNRLSHLADVDQSTLNKIELGKRSPTDDVLSKLAPVLAVPYDQLKAWADADRLGDEGLERLARHIPALQAGLDNLKNITGETQALEAMRQIDPAIADLASKLMDLPPDVREQRIAGMKLALNFPPEQWRSLLEAGQAVLKKRDAKK